MTQKPQPSSSTPTPWYARGIRFQCQRCGSCCGGEPGYVWVTRQDIIQMSAHLGISTADFRARFLRRVGFRLSLTERPNGDCILLQDGCSVYPLRPRQCRSFPFWDDALRSPEWFRRVLRGCPGVGKGRLYSRTEIDSISRQGFPTETSDDAP